MEMGSNDIMSEPEENRKDEGHEAEPDMAAQTCMKTAKGFIFAAKERRENSSSER